LEIVIASEAKQSIAQARKNGLLRRCAPRNDGNTQLRIPAALIARVVHESFAQKHRGRGECRVRDAPAASRAK
jgi:hypothetical protein